MQNYTVIKISGLCVICLWITIYNEMYEPVYSIQCMNMCNTIQNYMEFYLALLWPRKCSVMHIFLFKKTEMRLYCVITLFQKVELSDTVVCKVHLFSFSNCQFLRKTSFTLTKFKVALPALWKSNDINHLFTQWYSRCSKILF